MRQLKFIILAILFNQFVSLKAGDLGDPSCSSLLLVSNWRNNNVKIYDGCSGDYIRDLDSQNLISGPLGILEAPDGDILVVSEKNGRIIKFDRNTLLRWMQMAERDESRPGITNEVADLFSILKGSRNGLQGARVDSYNIVTRGTMDTETPPNWFKLIAISFPFTIWVLGSVVYCFVVRRRPCS